MYHCFFRRHVCLSNLKHAPSRELPLTARKTVFSHVKFHANHFPHPRLWTRDRDIGPAIATSDPQPAIISQTRSSLFTTYMTEPVSSNQFPPHQIEIVPIHIAMNVICLQWHLSLGWLRHHRVVVSIVISRHHPSMLTPMDYNWSIKTKETTSFKCLNLLKKS